MPSVRGALVAPKSKVELFAAIRRDSRAEGLSVRALARKYDVHRRMVREALTSAWPEPRKKLPPRKSRLDPFKPVVDQMLRADLDAPRKQVHTVKRVFGRLVAEHEMEGVSYATVADYVRWRRPAIRVEEGRGPAQVFIPQAHQPGAEAEVDFGDVWIMLAGVPGLTDAAQIHAELQQRGWAGSPQTVRRYVHLLRQAGPAVTPAPAVPKTREITRWLLSRPGSLDDGDQVRLAAVRAGCPHLDALAGHIRDFADMMTRRQGLLALEDWLTRVEADDQPELHSLATGIRRDQQAVTAGLALPYSSAAMEGNVNKIKMIKMIKRQMYGRAGFALLRKRVILHPA